jgi:pimeloyl-ACP methyl ester carboxylesterase
VRPLLAALSLLALAACDSQTPPPLAECPGAADCPDVPDVVAGVDLNALFAAPTAAERDSVATRLARSGGTDAPRATQARRADLATDPDGTRYTLVTLLDADGREITHAVARTPGNSVGGGNPLPVLFLLPDGDGHAAESSFLTGATAAGLDRTTVQIVVAARGASLTTHGFSAGSPGPVVHTSDTPARPYLGDVLDLLAFTERLGLVPRADAARLGAVGLGRGGAVALLAAERVPDRFRALAPLGAPTSLFDPTFRTTVRQALSGGSAGRLPAAETLLAPARALARGEISLAEARLRMLELSPVALAGRLPATRAFHASPDDIVPLAHLNRLRAEGGGTTLQPRLFDAVPEVQHGDLLTDTTLRGLLSTFFGQYL